MISIALAKIFAIYFIVVGLSLLINRNFFKEVLKDLVHSHIAMLIIAILTLILGAILVVVHGGVTHGWQLSVTIMCWLTLAAGVARTLFPTFIQHMAADMLTKDAYFFIAGLGSILLGLFYGYIGFCG